MRGKKKQAADRQAVEFCSLSSKEVTQYSASPSSCSALCRHHHCRQDTQHKLLYRSAPLTGRGVGQNGQSWSGWAFFKLIAA